MKAKAFNRTLFRHVSVAAGGALALFVGIGAQDVRAQAPTGPPATAEPGWYGYYPGSGWVRYAAPPAPPATSTAPGSNVASAPTPRGWTAYAPATGWLGYAPASSPTYPNSPLSPPHRRILTADGSRRYAAYLAVNGLAPELTYTISSYREYGTGRNIPLAKPWLPPSP